MVGFSAAVGSSGARRRRRPAGEQVASAFHSVRFERRRRRRPPANGQLAMHYMVFRF
jgi:hypothetical protein